MRRRPGIDPIFRTMAHQVGVTRIARVTAMDRAGVEVVAAIRPRGHVLQVSHGKGLTFRSACLSAIGEAAELHASEYPEMRRVVHSRASDLDGLVLDDDGLFRAWVRGVRASDGVAVWLAAERVYCPPKGVAWLGPSTARWTSNGLGAHRLKSRAIQHAMLEVWERHALTLAIPDGWTSDTVRRFGVALNTPQTRRLRGRGFEVVACLFARRPLPLAGVLLFDLQEQVIPLTAGYACRLSDGEALEAALLEAVQSRLTEIHGAREDVAFSQRVSAESLRLPERRKWHPGSTASALPQTVKSRIVIVELRRTPLFVVKAVGVDLETSELLL